MILSLENHDSHLMKKSVIPGVTNTPKSLLALTKFLFVLVVIALVAISEFKTENISHEALF